MSEAMDITDELLQVAQAGVEKAQPTEVKLEMTEWVFANEMNPALIQMFHSLYDGVFKNRIGVAHVKDAVTGKIATLIVGVSPSADGNNQLFPLARVLEESEMMNFLAPDGKGGWIGEQTED